MYDDGLWVTPGGSRPLDGDELTDPSKAISRAVEDDGCVWLHLVDPGAADMAAAQEQLGIHELAAEDAATGMQHPKAERYPNHLFVALWRVAEFDADQTCAFTEVFEFVGDGWLLTVERTDGSPATDFGRLVTPHANDGSGSMAAHYRVLADIVSGYASAAAQMEAEIGRAEADVFDPETREDVKRIYTMHQNVGRLDRAVSSLAATLQSRTPAAEARTPEDAEAALYVRDLIDDAVGIAALTSNQSRALDAIVSSHQSNVSLRQNTDMRTISAFAALVAVPGVVAGLYGMNFKDLPLTGIPAGWAVVLAAVVAIDAGLFWAFKRRRWL